MKNVCRHQPSSAPAWGPLPLAEYPGKHLQPKADKQGGPERARLGVGGGRGEEAWQLPADGRLSPGMVSCQPQPLLKFSRHPC